MNERIEKLAERAGYAYGSYDSFGLFDVEKFAELIVGECTDILSTYRVRFEDGVEYNCDHPIIAINKHFGVDE